MDEWNEMGRRVTKIAGAYSSTTQTGTSNMSFDLHDTHGDKRYGRDIADILKANCNVKIFIGSDDEARREFSSFAGRRKSRAFRSIRTRRRVRRAIRAQQTSR
ncbi:MAG: TraM recognition domain-containing protein [Christensenellaceae bacterium]